MNDIGYLQIWAGPIIFYLVMAIFSVPLTATTLGYCIRGLLLTDKVRQQRYQVIFWISASMALIFLPAIVTYHWLDISNSYDGMYHIMGYFGSITLMIIVGIFASQDRVAAPSFFFISLGISVVYLLALGFIGSAALGTVGNPYTPQSSGLSSQNIASMVVGLGYGLLQFIIPLLYYFYVKQNRDKILQRTANTLAPAAPPTAPSQVTPVTTPDQSETSGTSINTLPPEQGTPQTPPSQPPAE